MVCNGVTGIRKFYSKGAHLMVVWTFFFSISFWSHYRLSLFDIIQNRLLYASTATVSLLVVSTAAPLIGWLADTQFGNYKIFVIGNTLIFLASVLRCIFEMVFANILQVKNVYSMTISIVGVGVLIVVYGLVVLGVEACLISLMKLGLDQMPDASKENISSFIAWTAISYLGGVWMCELFFSLGERCLPFPNEVYNQILSITPALGASCMCSLILLFSKWLIIEPKSQKALAEIYQVLKFAWKHKSPLNGSALTYWEENVPSRMDLGKSRFGGPFTTEQVEDVKTFFKMLIFFLSIVLVSFSSSSVQDTYAMTYASNSSITVCTERLVFSFGYNPNLSSFIIGILYELFVYRITRNRLLSIQKQIGMASLIILAINTIHGTVKIAGLKYNVGGFDWLYMAYCIVIGPVLLFFVVQFIQFACAQSPYKMRGVIMGRAVFTYAIPSLLGKLIVSVFEKNLLCDGQNCIVIHSSVCIASSLIGFLSYCVVARWYKMRVRDEEYDVHRVVEEVYDRYLSERS